MPIESFATASLVLGDVDGDGDLDLFVGHTYSNYTAGQSRLYLNGGSGTFTDATASRMPVGGYDISSLAMGDVDGDGDLDLVLGNRYQPSRLYLNNGSGTFSDATVSACRAGATTPARWRSATSTVMATSTWWWGTTAAWGRLGST